MPFVSNAQRKFMNAAADRGEIAKKTVEEFNEASKGKHLPEYVKNSKKKRFSRTMKHLSRG